MKVILKNSSLVFQSSTPPTEKFSYTIGINNADRILNEKSISELTSEGVDMSRVFIKYEILAGTSTRTKVEVFGRNTPTDQQEFANLPYGTLSEEIDFTGYSTLLSYVQDGCSNDISVKVTLYNYVTP